MRFFTLVFSLVFLLGCKETDDQAQIRALFDEVATSAEKHDIAGMMEHATKDFEAHPGARAQSQVRPALYLMFRRYGVFEVKHPDINPQISADGLTATVKVPIIVAKTAGTPDDEAAPDAANSEAWADAMRKKFGDPYYFEFRLKKVAGKWKIWQAHVTGTRSIL